MVRSQRKPSADPLLGRVRVAAGVSTRTPQITRIQRRIVVAVGVQQINRPRHVQLQRVTARVCYFHHLRVALVDDRRPVDGQHDVAHLQPAGLGGRVRLNGGHNDRLGAVYAEPKFTRFPGHDNRFVRRW